MKILLFSWANLLYGLEVEEGVDDGIFIKVFPRSGSLGSIINHDGVKYNYLLKVNNGTVSGLFFHHAERGKGLSRDLLERPDTHFFKVDPVPEDVQPVRHTSSFCRITVPEHKGLYNIEKEVNTDKLWREYQFQPISLSQPPKVFTSVALLSDLVNTSNKYAVLAPYFDGLDVADIQGLSREEFLSIFAPRDVFRARTFWAQFEHIICNKFNIAMAPHAMEAALTELLERPVIELSDVVVPRQLSSSKPYMATFSTLLEQIKKYKVAIQGVKQVVCSGAYLQDDDCDDIHALTLLFNKKPTLVDLSWNYIGNGVLPSIELYQSILALVQTVEVACVIVGNPLATWEHKNFYADKDGLYQQHMVDKLIWLSRADYPDDNWESTFNNDAEMVSIVRKAHESFYNTYQL